MFKYAKTNFTKKLLNQTDCMSVRSTSKIVLRIISVNIALVRSDNFAMFADKTSMKYSRLLNVYYLNVIR